MRTSDRVDSISILAQGHLLGAVNQGVGEVSTLNVGAVQVRPAWFRSDQIGSDQTWISFVQTTFVQIRHAQFSASYGGEHADGSSGCVYIN